MTNTIKTLISVLIIAILSGLGWYVYTHRSSFIDKKTVTNNSTGMANTSPNLRSSTITLKDLKQPHLTTKQTTALLADLDNASKYSATTDYTLVGDCGSSANVEILKKLNEQRQVQIFNGAFPVVRTPNTQNWDKAAAAAFVADSTIVCGVGFFIPFDVAADHVLWRNSCGTGMLATNADGTPQQAFVRCLQAQEAISIHYDLID